MAREDFDLSSWDVGVWSGETAEAYCAACLIDMNTGDGPKTKDKCKLPIRKPGSKKPNLRAVFATAGGRGVSAVQAPRQYKVKAAKAIIRLYGRAGEKAPDAIYRLAGMTPQRDE